jgi:CheY-like chemotaxis protein
VFVLLELGYIVEAAVDGREATMLFPQFEPDLVVLDMRMPKMSGPNTCAFIRRTSDVPIIMFTSTDDAEEVKNAILKGATDFVLKSSGVTELTERIEFRLKEIGKQVAQNDLAITPATPIVAPAPSRAPLKTTTLVIDPDETSRAAVKAVLTRLNQDCVEASSAEEAIQAFQRNIPDIVITEWSLPDMDAYSMLSQFKQKRGGKELIKLMMSSRLTPEAQRKATYGGITAFLQKPLDGGKVEVLVADSVRKAIRGLKKQARKAA